jgi:hypothetical protein
MNKREAAIVTAYTGLLIGSFSDAHEYMEELFGHPIYTHQMAGKEFNDELKVLSKPDFVALSDNISDKE